MSCDALYAAYRSVLPRLPGLTFEQFRDATSHCRVEAVLVRGELAGAVLIQGAELHACILPAFFGRWLTRSVLRRTLAAVLEQHGHAITRTTVGNEAGAAFVARLGFTKIAEQDGIETYMLEKK
jgi:hypothetical protein